MPCGAATTGTRAYLSAMVAFWKALTERLTSSKAPSAMAMASIARLAPTEKFAPWLADHQPHSLGLGPLHRPVDHGQHVAADGVHLGVELQAEDAVAQVDDRGAGVPLHLGPALLEEQEVDAARRDATTSRQASVAGSRVRRRLPSST